MDLQWQRQIELWLRLMGAPYIRPALQLALSCGQDTHYLEVLSGRALLSVARPVTPPERKAALLRLLTLLQPEAGGGIPLRAWVARGCLCLAATAPRDSGAELWVQLAHRQRHLLGRAAGSTNEP